MILETKNSKMWKEIHQQPEAINAALTKNAEVIKKIAAEVKERGIKTVVFDARGSSEHACQVARYLFETYCGMVVSIAAPSIITRYEGNIDLSNTLTIGVSQSGGAQDVFEFMKKCDEAGGVCVCLTNVRDSLMTKAGKYYLNCECGFEESVTATKSYITQVTILTEMAAYISGNEKLTNELQNYSRVVEETLKMENQIRDIVPLFRNVDKIMIFGRGLLYAAGLETELKIQETSHLDARCYASSDYKHGPISTAQAFVPAIFFIADRRTNECIVDLHEKLKKEKKIFSLIISNDEDITKQGDYSILLPNEFDGMYGVYACAVLSQMFACLLSISRGCNPDAPEGVTKITVTK